MKIRFRRWSRAGIALLALFFAMIFSAASAHAQGGVRTLEGADSERRSEGRRVTLTLTEYKPGVSTVSGTLYISTGGMVCPLQGRYYEKPGKDGKSKGRVTGTAKCPNFPSELLVDGDVSIGSESDLFLTELTIMSPDKGITIFSGVLSGSSGSPGAETKPEGKPPPETSKADVGAEGKIPAVEGKEPSPPDKPEEWNGSWKGKTRSTVTVEGSSEVVREGEFEVRTLRDGQRIRFIGADREVAFNLTPSNPNAAFFREEKRETLSIGWADVIDKRVIFLRDGKLYLSIQQAVTGHSTIPGLAGKPVTETHSTIGVADRVK